MFDPKYKHTCVDRFLRYVKYDTQSDEESTSFPSTEKQKKLSADLAKELKKMGLKDASMDKWGYCMATLPANSKKKVPPIAFIAHVDTSPAVSGKGVKPIVHRKYKGGDIRLPKGGRTIKVSENPDLKKMKGFDIITSDGSTLLGADNKAGVAEIMDAAHYLITHPEVKHGPIKICFTPDEEVGRGTEKINLKRLGAKYAYTFDGSSRGEVEAETFSADMVVLTFVGKNIHPGYAKNKMINSIKIAAAFVESLPKKTLSPETTEKRQGYVHCTTINGLEETTTLKFIIRDFESRKLKEYERLLENLAKKAVAKFPGSKYELKVINQYRNMREALAKHPRVTAYAVQALKNLGIKPIPQAIRGGTDGSRLSFMGLPTPNIFAGEHSFHSQLEWVAVQDMEMAVQVIVEIAKIWEKRS
jgi:tripeptide aminopeptidase